MVWLLLVGCVAPADGPVPLWDRASEDLFASPWPSDHRRDEDGTLDVRGFPNPSDNSLLGQYLDVADQLDGFGTNSPIWFPLSGPVDLALLPAPADSIAEGSPVVLVDVDPASPGWGERVPVQVSLQVEETSYQPAHLLSVAPLHGFPLRPATTYGLVLTTGAFAPNDAFAAAWDDPLYADLRDVLLFQGLSVEDVAVATVFTTQDPLDEMARIVAHLHHLPYQPLDQEVVRIGEPKTAYQVFEGHYLGPVYQHGDRPYATTGGGFRFDDGGVPLVHSWDDMRMAIATPLDLEPPASGWPVVIYQHGTGGDYDGFANGDYPMEVASQLASAGLVGIGIDQPLHGTRATPGTETDWHSFNYLNPESARANFRQGAIDAVYLARLLAGGATFTTPEGEVVPIDPDRIAFMGHSQGGLTGSLALPWLGRHVDSAVISGAGGVLSITIVERKDPLDIADLLATILGFSSAEAVTEDHPVVGLVQMLTEVTDPVNYAPFWFAERGDWETRPTPVLVFSGLDDAATPFRTAEALASAARTPWLAPGVTAPDSQLLRGLDPQPGPLQENATAWDGAVTAALSQWAEGDHFVVFDEPDAARLYRDFLETAAGGTAVIAP